jgi:hypothetical protein
MSASIGALRVREDFKNDNLVTKINRYTADLIDICHNESTKGGDHDPEVGRLWSLAMTHYEDAAMWAVKAATAPKK